MAQTAKGKQLGDALIAHLTGEATVTAIATPAWSRHMAEEPTYPIAPATDCPSITLELHTEDIKPKPLRGGMGSLITLSGSLWIKRLQVPGQQHQTLLIADAEAVMNTLLGNWRPTEFIDVAGQTNFGITFDNPRLEAELRHPLGDPSRTVSVCRIPFIIVCESIG